MDNAEFWQILVSGGVIQSDVYKCMDWAFGPDWESAPMKEAGQRWNARHGDLFTLTPFDPIDESLRRIAVAFLESCA